MTHLDCQDADAALQSLATAWGRQSAAVGEAIRTCAANWTEDDPQLETAGPREDMRFLDVADEDAAFEGTYYFHGTRVLGPDTFSDEGILPLGQIVDRLWASLHTLVTDEVSAADWRHLRAGIEADAGGPSGGQYRLKTERPYQWGPYALLARKQHLVQ